MIETSRFYHQNAPTFFERYRSLSTPDVIGEAISAVPTKPSLVLDIGSGSGRDSEWLAAQGHTVVSVEPAKALRDMAIAGGQDRRIIHFHATLPGLDGIDRFVGRFDFVLCSAVWMHLDEDERPVGALRLFEMMKPGASAIVTFKVAPEDKERLMYEIDPEVAAEDFRAVGFDVDMNENFDLLGRDDTRWFTCTLRKAWSGDAARR
jgi:2-polyprenyl-3-methyl-5-hydroxy-6-metoxy-1,4-benzoquinol methylase